ncbi:hypothetical protein V8E36_000771 [Tilletia maclaganii]
MDYTATASMIGIAPPPAASSHSDTLTSSYTSKAGGHVRHSLSKDERQEQRRQRQAARANRKDPIHGDNLTHMPLSPRSSLPIEPGAGDEDKYTSLNHRRALDPGSIIEKSDCGNPTSIPAYVGATPFANDMLLERERRRIAAAPSKNFIARRRMWAGIPTLLIIAPATYCLAKSCTAWLALSPASVVFSDAREGTTSSPDPTARTLAMLQICICAISMGFNLLAVVYLRVSRQRTRLGRAFVWICALVAITLQTALALINILLVFFWHRKYSASPTLPFASTRDVGVRCKDTWEFDILYTAARYSQLADQTGSTPCAGGGMSTVRDYMIAGGVRLALFLILGVWWLIMITRYNRALASAMLSPFAKTPAPDAADIAESAELHRLLEEEKLDIESRVPGAWDPNAGTVRSSYPTYDNKGYANFEETVVVVTASDDDDEPEPYHHMYNSGPAAAASATAGPTASYLMPSPQQPNGRMSMPLPHGAPSAPQLSHFDWQRREASGLEDPPAQVTSQYLDPYARREPSSGLQTSRGLTVPQQDRRREGSGSFSEWASNLVSSVFGGAMASVVPPAAPQTNKHLQQSSTTSAQARHVPYTSVHNDVAEDDDDDFYPEQEKMVLGTGPDAPYNRPLPLPPASTGLERGPSELGVSTWFGGGGARTQQPQIRDHNHASTTTPVLNRHDDSESEGEHGGGGYASSRTSMSDTKGEGYAEWSRQNYADLAAMDNHRASAAAATASSNPGGLGFLAAAARKVTTRMSTTNGAHVAAQGAVPSARRYSSDSNGDELPHMPEVRAMPRSRVSSKRRRSSGSSGGGGQQGRAAAGPTVVRKPVVMHLSGPNAPSSTSHQRSNSRSRSGPPAAAGTATSPSSSSYDSDPTSQFWVVDHMRLGAGHPLSANDATGDLLPPQPEAPTFVRQLGQLVRKLSAIESVGSAGEREMRSSSGSASYLSYGGHGGHGGGGIRGGASAGRRSTSGRMGSVEEEEAPTGVEIRYGSADAGAGRTSSRNSLAVPHVQEYRHHQQQQQTPPSPSSGGPAPGLPGGWSW